MVRKIWRILAAVLLIVLGAGGLQGLWNNLGTAETLLQHSVFGGQIVLGVAGIVAGLGGLFRKPFAGPAALVFAIGMAYAAGVGPVAWGDVGWTRGLLEAGVVFVVALVLYGGVRNAGGGKPST